MDDTCRLLMAWIRAQGYEVNAFNPPDSFKYTKFDVKKKPKSTRTKTVEYSEEFEQCWKLYPKKSGNKKAAAYEQWNMRKYDSIYKEEMPNYVIDQMLEGTKRYAAYHKALNTPEQYIHQGSTFYGRERLYMDDWTIPKESTKLRLPRDDNDLVSFAKKHRLKPPPLNCSYIEYRKLLQSEIDNEKNN